MSANEYIKRLGDERRSIWEQAKNILDSAEREHREFTPDESARFDQASKDMDSKAERIRGLVEQDEQNKQTEELLTRALGAGNTGNAGQQSSETAGPDETDGLRKFLTGMRQGGAVEAFVPATRNAAPRALVANRTGQPMQAEQRAFTKAVAAGTPGGGAPLVPTTLYDQLIQHLVLSSAIIGAGCTVLETAGAGQLDIPITTDHGAAIARIPEAAPITGTDATFDKRSLYGYKYGQLIQVSRELLDDENFDIISYIATSAGRNVGLKLGADLLNGTGSSQPLGIIPGAALGANLSVVGATGAIAGGFSADNLIDLMFKVTAPYRNSPAAAWLVQDATLGAIRKLKDGAGRYLFDPAPFGAGFAQTGAPDRLLGKPIYSDPYMPAVALSAKSVVFGDISRYFVRIAGGGVRFERSDEYAFNTDLVTFKAVIRADGTLVDRTGAVAYFAGGAT